MSLTTALTAVIGTVAKGKAAKAMAGGAAGVVLTAGQPIVDAFLQGVSTGALPKITELGTIIGATLAGYAVGFVVTYLAPANKPA